MSGTGPTGSGDRLRKDVESGESSGRGRGGYSLRRRQGSTNLLQSTQVSVEAYQATSMMALPVPLENAPPPAERSTSSPSLAIRTEERQPSVRQEGPVVYPGFRPPTPQVPRYPQMVAPQYMVVEEEPMDIASPARTANRRPMTADPRAKPPCSPEKRKK